MRNKATELDCGRSSSQGKHCSPRVLSAASLAIPILALISLTAVPSVRANPYDITIVSVVTTDEGGNPKNVFSRGEIVVVKVRLNCPGATYAPVSVSYLQFVRTTDPVLHMVYLGFMSSTISSGESQSSSSGYRIPLTAMTGGYTVKVMLSNTRPSNNQFKVLAEDKQTSFTVT